MLINCKYLKIGPCSIVIPIINVIELQIKHLFWPEESPNRTNIFVHKLSYVLYSFMNLIQISWVLCFYHYCLKRLFIAIRLAKFCRCRSIKRKPCRKVRVGSGWFWTRAQRLLSDHHDRPKRRDRVVNTVLRTLVLETGYPNWGFSWFLSFPPGKYLWNVGRQLFYTAVQPRRQFWTSYLPPWELEISHTLN
jgi:hypothetical protein